MCHPPLESRSVGREVEDEQADAEEREHAAEDLYEHTDETAGNIDPQGGQRLRRDLQGLQQSLGIEGRPERLVEPRGQRGQQRGNALDQVDRLRDEQVSERRREYAAK